MIEFDDVGYRYPEAARPALSGVSFDVPEASFTLVVGPSGSGKSTLLRCISGLAPHFSGGAIGGAIRVAGVDPVAAGPGVMSRYVGCVFQDPEAQSVMDRVADEIVFALEQAGVPRPEMRVRLEEVLDLLDLAPLRDRRLDTLSGGERQRVAIAAALALRPRVLVLDEPTSQLDPQSAEDVLQALVRLNHDLGLTIVLAEHRLERVLSYADQIVAVGTGGAGVLAGPPEEVIARIDIAPPLVALARALGWSPLPLTVKAGLRHSRPLLARQQIPPRPAPAPGPQGQPFLQLQRVEVGYGARQVLRGTSLDVWPGEIVALLGRNGAGKTTLLKTLVGLVRPQRGRAVVAGQDTARQTTADICRRLAYLPQDPNTLLFADTVREELQITLRNHRRAAREDQGPRATPGADDALLVPSLLDRLGIAEYAGAYPRDLSAGERQRVALAAVSVTGPGGLLLDEPTRGLDYGAKRALAGLLRGWRSGGMAILLVTHDVEFAATVADRAALLSQGEVIASGPTVDVLGSSPLFAPQVARLFPGSGWLTVDDVLGAHVAAAQA